MKRFYFPCILLAVFLASCTKSNPANSTTNNTTVEPTPVAAYTVDGIKDVVMTDGNYSDLPASLPIQFTYHDSVQSEVTVSVSGVPSFISWGTNSAPSNGGSILSTGPWTGVPTFDLDFVFYFANQGTAYVKGTYPITLTSTNTQSGTKTFTFNLICD